MRSEPKLSGLLVTVMSTLASEMDSPICSMVCSSQLNIGRGGNLTASGWEITRIRVSALVSKLALMRSTLSCRLDHVSIHLAAIQA